MKGLKVVFMGTPDFAVASLEAIIGSEHEVVAVVTAPDKPAGRGRKLNTAAVKKHAQAWGLPILQPTNLKDPDFIQELQSFHADVQVVVAFRMLPKVVWSLPLKGTFNLHASLLPDYRGAAPIHWAIINGATQTGVTTFFIDEKIDTGAVILQEKTHIGKDETLGSLHSRLMAMGGGLTVKTLNLIATETAVKTTIQPKEHPNTAPKLSPEICDVDWSDSLDNVYNKIRGLNPFPCAKTTLKYRGKSIATKIFEVSKEVATHHYKNGKITTHKKTLKVAVLGGYLIIKSLQIAGKRKMETADFLNGVSLGGDAYFTA